MPLVQNVTTRTYCMAFRQLDDLMLLGVGNLDFSEQHTTIIQISKPSSCECYNNCQVANFNHVFHPFHFLLMVKYCYATCLIVIYLHSGANWSTYGQKQNFFCCISCKVGLIGNKKKQKVWNVKISGGGFFLKVLSNASLLPMGSFNKCCKESLHN